MGSLGVLLAALLLTAPVAAEPPPVSGDADTALPEAAAEAPPAEAEAAAPVMAAVAEVEAPVPAPVAYTDLAGTLESFDELGWLRVSVRSSSLRARSGYSPLEVILHSTDARPHPVTVAFQGHSAATTRVSRTVELGARQRLALYLLVPASMAAGSVSVTVPGNPPVNAHSVYLYRPGGLTALVIGDRKGFEAGTSLPLSEEEQPAHLSTLFVPAQQAPRELAAYVGFDVVMVTEEVASLPPDLWATLEHQAAAGGALLLMQPPRDLLPRLPLLSAGDTLEPWRAYGLGQVALCSPSPTDCQAALSTLPGRRGLPIAPRGFGRGDLADRFAYLGHSETPLLPNALAPLGRFLVLIFLFTLLVGPGGLYLARRRGPVALLVGVPAVALLTCLLIIADSVLREGFVTHVARYSYSVLDRPRDRLITAAVAGYYANLSPRALQVPAQGVLLESEEGPDPELELDWSAGGMRTEGFLPSRTYVEWGELDVLPTRARLVVRPEGDAVKVQNALGAPLQAGVVRLGGVDYPLGAVDEGGQTLASPAREVKPLSERLPVVSPLQGRSRPSGSFWRPLEDGEFVVRLGGAGFGFMTALPAELHEGVHYMRGTVDGP
ncbi:hypothetical protein [Stigmatella erecta]|uniref:Uncharacterized protein n=1 Tax=Stigmatella erecta TaxID=83460 RepID=A0A1I0GXV7_9BACT|nr:hypothetical protein [Stigmatella erecta]SET76035.1 hypothetical protein SAMN05443639_104214 [Stigmatella erecta]